MSSLRSLLGVLELGTRIRAFVSDHREAPLRNSEEKLWQLLQPAWRFLRKQPVRLPRVTRGLIHRHPSLNGLKLSRIPLNLAARNPQNPKPNTLSPKP